MKFSLHSKLATPVSGSQKSLSNSMMRLMGSAVSSDSAAFGAS
jgi:hypothetical protein